MTNEQTQLVLPRFHGKVVLEAQRQRGYGNADVRMRWMCVDRVRNVIHAHGGVPVGDERAVWKKDPRASASAREHGYTREEAFSAAHDRVRDHITAYHEDSLFIAQRRNERDALRRSQIDTASEPLYSVRGLGYPTTHIIAWEADRPLTARLIGPFANDTEAREYGRKWFPRRYKTFGAMSPEAFVKTLGDGDKYV